VCQKGVGCGSHNVLSHSTSLLASAPPPPNQRMPPSHFPHELRGGQSHVNEGVGPPGGVAVILASMPGQSPIKVFYVSGTAVLGYPRLVLTVQHALSDLIRNVSGSVFGDVQVWAMPIDVFRSLGPLQEIDLSTLGQQDGVVCSKSYYTLVKDDEMEDTGGGYPSGVDCAILELEENLIFPPNQPGMITEQEALSLGFFIGLGGMPNNKVDVVLEGFGDYLSEGDRIGNSQSMQVEWLEASPGTWMSTQTTEAKAAAIRSVALKAWSSRRNPRAHGSALLPKMFTPTGFSGGGVYIKVPAVALNDDNAPGGNHASPKGLLASNHICNCLYLLADKERHASICHLRERCNPGMSAEDLHPSWLDPHGR
jgi:hypothetical protein